MIGLVASVEAQPYDYASVSASKEKRAENYVRREFIENRNKRAQLSRQQGDHNNSYTSAAPYYSGIAPHDIDPRLAALRGDIYQQAHQKEPASALEKMYARRIVNEVEQFGYDLFGVPAEHTRQFLDAAALNSFSIPSGSVQDDFTMDIGDQLEVVFTGQRTDRDIYTINNQGMLLINDFPPIPAAGRSIGQVRISIEAAARNLHNTRPYVSLASVRQIGVLVVGHVKKPGRKNLTVFHTVLDALMESGGIEKTGSLRQIKLVRNGRSQLIDIYSLLLHGATNADLQLQDGDRIIIPSIGPTLAIAGEVKRPGIYELLPEIKGMRHKPETSAQKISLNEALEKAGGVLVSGQNRFLKLSVTPSGREQVTEISDPFHQVFSDGSILMVSKGREKRSGVVELTGHTRAPGIYALDETPTLSALLADETVLDQNIYPLIGLIERWDARQLTTTFLEFPLQLVIADDYDRKLQEDDIIHLFSRDQILSLKASPKEEKTANTKPQDDAFDGYVQEASYSPQKPAEYGSAYQGRDIIEDPSIQSFLSERAVFVRGAVRNAGHYPVASGVTLDNLLAVAGGLALEANVNNIEVTSSLQGSGVREGRPAPLRRIQVNLSETSASEVLIGPGDSIRVNQKFDKIEDKSVLIMGEVQNPGRYDLVSGDKVSDLLERAGGLTFDAYPEGAIFSRKSERRAEESRYRAAARDLERALAISLEKDDGSAPNTTQIAMARSLAEELREVEAVGRITVETDPGMLAANPELDMLLESGDRIFMPKRPLSVRVHGEVLSPASLQFRESKKPLDYIHEAGGFTFHADKERTFVLYPDGSAQPLQVSSWNYKPVLIPPGSTIIVPRDPKPFDFIQSAKDISQILSNLAITAIFLDDVRDD
ncbi:MAG: SLBB domain-containing protein [Alphaproteobacteria bacterium]